MRLRAILKSALVLIGASIFLAYLIVSNYHFNELKPRISKAVSDLTGRELTLGGNIQFKVGFRPVLAVEDVRFQNASWGSRPDLARIKRFELEVALLPLILGDIDVRRFILVEPDILLEKDHSGRWNIGLKGKKREASAEVKAGEVGNKWELPVFGLNRLQIRKGRLVYKDGESAKTHIFTLESVSADATGPDSPVALALTAGHRGKSFEVAGTLGPLSSFVDPNKAWPLNLLAKTGGATVRVEGVIKDVFNAKGFSFNVRTEGKSTAEITDLLHMTNVPDLRPFKVTGKVADPNGKLTIDKLNAEMGHEAMAKMEVLGLIQDPLAKRGFDLKIAIVGKDLPTLEKLLRRPLRLNGPFHASGRLTDPDGRWAVKDFNLQMGSLKTAKLRLTGTVNNLLAHSGFDLEFHAQGKDLASLEKLLKQPLPLKGPYKISGRVNDLGHKTFKFSDFEGSLRNSDLSGSLEISLARKRPRLTAVLSSRELDLRPFLPKKKGKGGKARRSVETTARRKVFSSDKLTLDSLKRANVAIKINTKRVLLPRLALRDFNAQVDLEDGHLRVKEIRSFAGGGTLKGRFDVRPWRKGAAVAAALKIEKLDLGRMLKDLKITEEFTGKVDVDMNIHGRGRSVAGLMAGLNGKITVVMENGRIHNRYIDMLGADVSSTLGKLLDASDEEANHTELNCFVCRFDIKDGLADSTVLVVDTDATSLIGDGDVDLKTEKLDVKIKPLPKRGIGISGVGKITLSISEFARPVKLGGTLKNPAFVIDASQTAITMGKAFGGMLLLGPLGFGAALVSGWAGSDNPCPAAITLAEKGPERSKPKKLREEILVKDEPEEDFFQREKTTVKGDGGPPK